MRQHLRAGHLLRVCMHLRALDPAAAGKGVMRDGDRADLAVGVGVVHDRVVVHDRALVVDVAHLRHVAVVDVGDVDAVGVQTAGVVPGVVDLAGAEREPCGDADAADGEVGSADEGDQRR